MCDSRAGHSTHEGGPNPVARTTTDILCGPTMMGGFRDLMYLDEYAQNCVVGTWFRSG